jgi:hypothetical protein
LGAIEFFTRPEQHIAWRVLGFLVRARAEIFMVTTLVVVFVQLQAWVTPAPEDETIVPPEAAPVTGDESPPMFGPPHIALLIMLGALAVLLVIPASRRFLVRRIWCVTTRHRMRSCFVQSRTMTLHGRLPFLLWSRPSPVGERVRVWLPAGLSVKDIDDDAPRLATACWAREVRVTPTRWQAALVVVDIVRRDPLGARTVLTPAVLDDIDGDDTAPPDGTVVPLPDRWTLPTPPVDTPAATGSTGVNGSGPRTRKTPATTTGPAGPSNLPDPPVTGFGGVDVSDYV